MSSRGIINIKVKGKSIKFKERGDFYSYRRIFIYVRACEYFKKQHKNITYVKEDIRFIIKLNIILIVYEK